MITSSNCHPYDLVETGRLWNLFLGNNICLIYFVQTLKRCAILASKKFLCSESSKKDIKQVLVVHEHNFHFGPFDQPRNDGQSTLIAWNTITTFLESKLYVFD